MADEKKNGWAWLKYVVPIIVAFTFITAIIGKVYLQQNQVVQNTKDIEKNEADIYVMKDNITKIRTIQDVMSDDIKEQKIMLNRIFEKVK